MAVIVIEKVAPYDGEHDLEMRFNLGEQARIFDIAKLRPTQYLEALTEADARFRVALAVVALERAGHRIEWLEPFYNAQPEHLLIDLTRGPGVPDPVPLGTSSPPNENGSEPTETKSSSGESSLTDGADSTAATDLSDSGSPGSETSAA